MNLNANYIVRFSINAVRLFVPFLRTAEYYCSLKKVEWLSRLIRESNSNKFSPFSIVKVRIVCGIDLSLFPIQVQSGFCMLVRGILNEREYIELLDEVSRLSASFIPYRQWLVLSAHMNYIGAIELSLVLRKKYDIEIYSIFKNNQKLSHREFCSLIETHGSIESASLYERIRFIKVGDKKRRHLIFLLDLYSGRHNKKTIVSDLNEGSACERNIVSLVAPVKTNELNGEEIDRFDEVVRLNYARSSVVSAESSGAKTTITYYSKERGRELLSNEDNIPTNVSAIVCKDSLQVNYFKNKTSIPVRPSVSFDSCMSRGNLNLMPYVILDLLYSGFCKIKVFHADLMLTSEKIKGYYNGLNYSDKDLNITRVGFVMHDPVTQFRCLKALFNKGYIVGDSAFQSVMSLTEEQYAVKLDRKYSKLICK